MSVTFLFDAFGNFLSKTGTTANDFLYTGEQYDANTGFYYLRARYMNPSTGTFTSPDAYAGTIFDPVSLHKYLYANANPVMNRDPSGYSTFTLTEMEASIVISGIIGAAMNSIPKGIMRLVSGEPMDDMFWFTFASDFIVGFECGMAFAAIGFLATQFLLLSCLVKSILFTMGLKFSFDCIGDLWHGNYGSAILNAIGAAFCFFGASGFNYKGSGLGLGGFADDAANLADDAANVADDVANAAGKNQSKIDNLIKSIQDWLGDGARLVKNKNGDTVIISADGTKRVRFDLYNTSPHNSPHFHIEEFIDDTWQKSGPIYPYDVPQN